MEWSVKAWIISEEDREDKDKQCNFTYAKVIKLINHEITEKCALKKTLNKLVMAHSCRCTSEYCTLHS